MVRSSASILVVLVSVLPVAAGPLPFTDGRYVTDPALCGVSDAELVRRHGDGVGAVVRNINGDALDNSYEMRCRIANVSVDGSDVTFDALCEAEGTIDKIRGHYVALSETAFRLGSRTFRRCD